MDNLSVQGLSGKDNPSKSLVKEWSYDEAVEKLMAMFDMKEENASHEIKFAVGGDIEDPIPQDRFDAAMRTAQRDPDNKISPLQLSHALIRFYAELRGKTIEIDISSTFTAQAILTTLEDDDMISFYDHGTVLFFYITEGCSADKAQLIAEFKCNPHNAVIGARSRNQISTRQARIAEFCLLTGLGPFEARDEGEDNHALRKDAQDDLYSAVEKALKTLKLSKRETASRLLGARLFPLKYVVSEVRDALLDIGFADFENDPTYAVARENFLITFFQQHSNGEHSTAVSVEEARKYLQDHDWYMEPAVRQWRKDVAKLPPLSHAGSRDTAGPPDVQKESLIVGLVGAVDTGAPLWKGSPGVDGWFFSDFYLWKHVLRGLAHRQKWITCVDPAVLVEKYTQGHVQKELKVFITQKKSPTDEPISWDTGYLHGEPTAPRAIVLDEATLDFATQDLLIFEEKTLLHDYLAHLETTFREAQEQNRPLLLLMFSHGDIETFDNLGGLMIGFHDLWAARKEDFLTAKHIADIHARYPDVVLTLFMTSCFSGHWVTTPYFVSNSVTVMAATRPLEPSHSFDASNSMRHAGGLFSLAFKQELEKEPVGCDEESSSRQYGEMMDDIAAAAEGLIRTPGGVEKGMASLPMFSPEIFYEKFHRRTGYPLADYKANYDRLQKVPTSSYPGGPGTSQTGGSRLSAYGPTNLHLKQSIEDLIWQYQKSMPTQLSNDHQLQHMIENYKSGGLSEESSLRILQSHLAFRAGKCSFANQIVKELKLYKGAATSISEWDPHQNLGREYRDRLSEIMLILKQNTSWFKTQKAEDGVGYEKPWLYLANAMALEKKNDRQVKELIATMKDVLAKTVAAGSKRVRGERSWNEVMLEHRAGKLQMPGSPMKKPRRKTIEDIQTAFQGVEENQEN